MENELRRLRDCARKRDRYRAAAAQADADARRLAEEARAKGATEDDIERAFAGKPAPRLVRAPRGYATRGTSSPHGPDAALNGASESTPKRVDLEREGWWGNGDD